MSAKLTVVFYILICFEIGALLIILPWSSYWNENFFLFYLTSYFHSDIFLQFMQSGYVRGAVTGLGIINVVMGFLEILHFRQTVDTILQSAPAKK
ncbi:MAG: hypothetical protein HY774_02620 [Acidobacteria bacterium]|nr:hypothetical protein [Acidobacteriota bacterium]